MVLKIILIALGVFIFLVFTQPLVTTKVNIGNITGDLLAIVLIVCGIFLNQIEGIITKAFETAIGKAIVIAFFTLLIIGFCIFTITLIAIINASRPTAKNEKTVILLGCRVKGDKPSTALFIRTKAARDYLRKNPDAVAILSGGQGPGENMTEAKCAYDLLVNDGIDKSRLYMEDKSTSTDENIRFSKKIIEENNLSSDIAIATSEYHQLRAKLIAKKYGFNAKAIPSSTVKFTRPPVYFREVFGILYFLIKH